MRLFKRKGFSIVTSKTAVAADILTEVTGYGGKTARFPSSSGQLFEGYFSPARSWKFGKSDLIDARGRRLFENTAPGLQCGCVSFSNSIGGTDRAGGAGGRPLHADAVLL